VLPSVAPFVSLAQTRTFHYTRLSHDPDLTSMDKPLADQPLLLDELVIDVRDMLPNHYKARDNGYYTHDDYHASVGVERLLSSTNPTRCHFLGRPNPIYLIPFYIQFPEGLDWSRTRTVIFTHASCSVAPDCIPAFSIDTPPFDLVFDLAGYGGYDVHDLDMELDGISDFCLHRRWRAEHQDAEPTLGHVQIWLRNEREVELAKKILIETADDKWKNNYSSLKIGVKQ
jgi:hypothetical protein